MQILETCLHNLSLLFATPVNVLGKSVLTTEWVFIISTHVFKGYLHNTVKQVPRGHLKYNLALAIKDS